jgi:hypothetical protein
VNISARQQIFSYNVAKLIEYIYKNDHSCTFGEAYRTSMQAQWYDNNGIGIRSSLHCKRLAIDLNLFDCNDKYLTSYKDYEIFGRYWMTLHKDNEWGGNFKSKDGNHFEMKEYSDEEKRYNEKVQQRREAPRQGV